MQRVVRKVGCTLANPQRAEDEVALYLHPRTGRIIMVDTSLEQIRRDSLVFKMLAVDLGVSERRLVRMLNDGAGH